MKYLKYLCDDKKLFTGGNELFGFVKGFRASHYCRRCDLSIEECSIAATENTERIRKIESYNEELLLLDGSRNHVRGIKQPCILNNIENYHILENQTFDIMHDILEGVIPTLLHHLFLYCVTQKLLKKSEIQDRVRDFNYGIKLKKSKPSFLDLKLKSDGSNLNQNATQHYCLMLNLPFILLDLKDELTPIWNCVQSLLIIMQIVFSRSISDYDLKMLEDLTENFLIEFINNFNAQLKPKFHFLTHYARAIRASGPLRTFWMMRMESKHKFFTHWVAQQKNFKNITQSLANKHQETMSLIANSYKDQLSKASNKKLLTDAGLISKFEACGIPTVDFYQIDFFTFNGIEYRNGFLITKNDVFFEIQNIISNNDNQFYFLCSPIKVENFNLFCNSFEIKRNQDPFNFHVIQFERLSNKNSYEIVHYKEQCFVKLETLDLKVANFIK